MIPRLAQTDFCLELWLQQNKPAVIRGALTAWNIKEHWSPEYLTGLLTNRRAVVRTSNSASFGYRPSTDLKSSYAFATKEMPFPDAVKLITSAETSTYAYMLQQPIPQLYPELMNHLEVPTWIRNNAPQIQMWFGNDSITPLHFDASNNLFAQVYGKKNFVLFSPFDSDFLYPFPTSAAMAHVSGVDLLNPDMEQHPMFARATAISCSLEPGDLLFLPAFWWHHVQSSGVAISVNFWWSPQPTQLIECPNSSRLLPKFYRDNRLAHVARNILRSHGLTILDMASMMQKKGRNWDACVLALAAFDRVSSQIYMKSLPARDIGCPLERLSEELTPLCDIVSQSQQLSTMHKQTIALVPALADQASKGAETDSETIKRLIAAVVALQMLPRP